MSVIQFPSSSDALTVIPPIQICIVLDASTSMRKKMTKALIGLNQAMRAQKLSVKPNDTYSLIMFNRERYVKFEHIPLTNFKALIVKKHVVFASGTSIYDTIPFALNKYTQTHTAFFIVTDGVDTCSKNSKKFMHEAIANAMKRTCVHVKWIYESCEEMKQEVMAAGMQDFGTNATLKQEDNSAGSSCSSSGSGRGNLDKSVSSGLSATIEYLRLQSSSSSAMLTSDVQIVSSTLSLSSKKQKKTKRKSED